MMLRITPHLDILLLVLYGISAKSKVSRSLVPFNPNENPYEVPVITGIVASNEDVHFVIFVP
jgi:hypothetical protein